MDTPSILENFGVQIATFFNSKIGLLLLGFLLTTVIGRAYANASSRAAWERQKRFELLSRTLDKQEALATELSQALGKRVYRLERVVWALEPPYLEHPLFDDTKLRARERWEEYYASVAEWNEGFRGYLSRIRHLAGQEIADRFYLSEMESRDAKSSTVYGRLVRSHYVVLDLMKLCADDPDRERTEGIAEAREALVDLYESVDDFLRHLYQAMDHRTDEIDISGRTRSLARRSERESISGER